MKNGCSMKEEIELEVNSVGLSSYSAYHEVENDGRGWTRVCLQQVSLGRTTIS